MLINKSRSVEHPQAPRLCGFYKACKVYRFDDGLPGVYDSYYIKSQIEGHFTRPPQHVSVGWMMKATLHVEPRYPEV